MPAFLIAILLIVWCVRRVRDYRVARAYDASIQRYRASLDANPGSADTHGRLGLIYLERGNPDAAGRHFGEALLIEPGNPDFVYHLGSAYEMKGDWNRAMECYREAYGTDPEYGAGVICRELGKAYVHCDNVERGMDLLELFLKKRNTDPEGRYWMAVALQKAGNVSQMIGELNLMMDQVRSDRRLLGKGGRHWVSRGRRMLRKVRCPDL